jgi:hypothetical protein
VEILIDSSGLKVREEGEWKVKMHGNEKRRGWIKLHIAANPKTQELIAIEVTDDKVADCTILPKLITNLQRQWKKLMLMEPMIDPGVESIYLIKVYMVAFLQEDIEKSEMK